MSTFNNFIKKSNDKLSIYKCQTFYLAKSIEETDAKLATYYYEKGWIEEKHVPSIFALAQAYEEGKGVIKNIKKAEEYKNLGKEEIKTRKSDLYNNEF